MMKIENIIRRILREQEQEKLSELPPFDDFFDNDWNLALGFMNRYPNKKFYHLGDLNLRKIDIESLRNLVSVEGNLDLRSCENLQSLGNLEYVGGNLYLRYTKIETLGNLVRVEGDLNSAFCQNLESLGNLEYVGDGLDLFDCENLKSLGNLVRVGGYLGLYNCKNLKSLANLNYVGDSLDLMLCQNLESLGNLEYVGGFLNLRRTPLSEKYTEEEIRNMVEVDGKIFM